MSGWPDPERPGVPRSPERDGWHWVQWPNGGEPQAVRWGMFAGQRWGWAEWRNGHMADRYLYLGPCLTPSEVAAQLAAARREGAEAMRERAARELEHEAAFLDANAFARPRCPVETKREDAATIRALAVEGESDA